MFDWITGFIEQTGYFGIALMMLAENIFPPIPSELIMPLAGFISARGELSVVGAVLVGSVGSVLGSTLWYFVGYWLGGERLVRLAARYGRWLTVTPEDIDATCAWFGRHGNKAVLIGRLVPAVRTLISVPAGIAKMPLLPFLFYSGIGTLAWTALLGGAGFILESQYQRVVDWLNPVSDIVIGILVLWYIYRVLTFGNGLRHSDRILVDHFMGDHRRELPGLLLVFTRRNTVLVLEKSAKERVMKGVIAVLLGTLGYIMIGVALGRHGLGGRRIQLTPGTPCNRDIRCRGHCRGNGTAPPKWRAYKMSGSRVAIENCRDRGIVAMLRALVGLLVAGGLMSTVYFGWSGVALGARKRRRGKPLAVARIGFAESRL